MKTALKTQFARFKCPSCAQQIETPAAAVKLNFQCPSCQAEFVPEHFTPEFYEEDVAPQPSKTTDWKIEHIKLPATDHSDHPGSGVIFTAKIFVFFGVIATVLAVVTALAGVVPHVSICIFASGCFTAAFMLGVIGNLMDIRDLLKK